MRCRGLTEPQHFADLPIPQLVCALPGPHLANSPDTIPVPRFRETPEVAPEVACCSGGD
jgi:hypothetical protein